MSRASEETTKGLVADKLKDIAGYPTAQNISVDGIPYMISLQQNAYEAGIDIFVEKLVSIVQRNVALQWNRNMCDRKRPRQPEKHWLSRAIFICPFFCGRHPEQNDRSASAPWRARN